MRGLRIREAELRILDGDEVRDIGAIRGRLVCFLTEGRNNAVCRLARPPEHHRLVSPKRAENELRSEYDDPADRSP